MNLTTGNEQETVRNCIFKTKYMETKIITKFQNDAKLPATGSASRQVMYMYSLAFTNCDCGEQLTMAQTIYADPTYKGECKCGKMMKLRKGKFWQSLS